MREKKVIKKFSELRNPISKGRVEWRYQCPFCPELTGKYDKDGALYYNRTKRVGACWKCRVVIVDDYNLDIESLYELYYAKRTKKKAQSYNINSWSEPAANVPWAQEYLHKRGFDDSLIQRYNLRAASLPIIGIVIPDVVYPDGTTNFFQYRFVGENKFKYTNPTEADKPVFGQHTLTGNTRAFVCEGCFSSMSMGKVPGWGALATYGKAIAPEQMKVLTKLKVDHYCLVYDGGEVDAILNTAAMLLETGKTVSALLLPFKEDPNSMSAEQLQASLENYELPINSLYLSIIRNYCKQSKIRNMQAQPWAQLRSYVVRLLDRSSAENNRSSEVQLR